MSCISLLSKMEMVSLLESSQYQQHSQRKFLLSLKPKFLILIFSSSLLVGFITTDGKNYPITESDFQLYQHGEAGEPPKNYSFTFKAGSKEYLVQVKENASSKFCIGLEAEARFVEMLCEFDVNGIKGWGAAEWHYRNLTGLPKNHLKSD